MKKIVIVVLLIIIFLFVGCFLDKNQTNRVPIIAMIQPLDGSTFSIGDTVEIIAGTLDPDGQIVEVNIYINNNKIVIDPNWYLYSTEYNWDTHGYEAGSYSIKVEAIDDDGERNDTSRSISLIKSNSAPQITSLSADSRLIEIGGISTLTCVASDEDYDELIYSWETTAGNISGDGSSVTFIAPQMEGTFAVTCTVSDAYGEEDKKSVNIISTEYRTVFVEGGTFQMGSSDGESDEQPVHSVTVSDFNMGIYEVTHAAYIAFLNDAEIDSNGCLDGLEMVAVNDNSCAVKYNGSSFYFADNNYHDNVNCPATHMTWYGAIYYANWLSELYGFDKVYTIDRTNITATIADFSKNGFRLPTEAEWEFAARGGNDSQAYTYSGSNNISDVAWYSNNSEYKTHPVGEKQANELGLYDMSGNVFELCWDWYSSSYYNSSPAEDPLGPTSSYYRVSRGSGFGNTARNLRVTRRAICVPLHSDNGTGFRLCNSVR